MSVQHIRSQIEQLDSLPTVPVVARKLLGVVDSPTMSMNEIGNLISMDQSLTARLLKMVNSPIYGFPGRISSVSQALILLGLNVVKGMVLGISVFEIMEKTMVGLWEHSLCTAVAAKTIANIKSFSEPEEIMVSALVHDIGKVALKIKFPEKYNSALLLSKEEGMLIKDSEEKVFELNHAEAGNWLASKWNFPKALLEPIGYHHKPSLAKNAPEQTAIVHMADMIVRARGAGFAGDDFVPTVDPKVWEAFSLNDAEINKVLTVIEDTRQEAEDIVVV